MKRRRPFKSRLRNAFVAAAGFLGFGTAGVVIEQLPKDPTTDTQIITTYDIGTAGQHGYNISFLDQFWKRSLALKGHDALAADLLEAAQNGDSWRIRTLIEHGGIDLKTDGGEALAAASRAEYNDVIKVLIDAGVPVNALNDAPFIAAMEIGHFDLAFRYVDMVAPSVENMNRGLAIAASFGSLDVVERFLARGVQVDGNNSAALVSAAAVGHTHIVSRLLQEKTVKTVYETAPAPLKPYAYGRHSAGFFTGCMFFPEDGTSLGMEPMNDYLDHPAMPMPEIVAKTVETYKVDLNASNGLPLKMAAMNGQEATFRQLIAAGADIKLAAPEILSNAVMSENVNLVSYILSLPGVDASANQSIALLQAVELNNHDIARALMKAHANVTSQILTRATDKGNEEMIDIVKGNDQGPVFRMVPISIL